MKDYPKIVALLCCMLWLASFVFGQSSHTQESPVFKQGNNVITYQFGYGHAMLHELKVDHFVRDHFSLLYSMRFSRPVIRQNATDAEFTAPIGASVGIGMGAVMASGSACGYFDPEAFFGVFVVSCMIPDGVALHINLHRQLDLSPYINFSGLTFASRNDETRFYYTPSAGIRLLYTPTPHFILTAEQQVLVRPERMLSTNLGLGMGFRF